MSNYSRDKDFNDGSEDGGSPKATNSNAPAQKTLFQFFRQKAKRDMDRSFSSARKSRRRAEVVESPNVKLLKDLNSSASPVKGKKAPSLASSPVPKSNTRNMTSPLRMADIQLYESKEESSISSEIKVQEPPPNKTGPLFIRLIQNSSRSKERPDVPMAPKPKRNLASSLRNSQCLYECEVEQANEKLAQKFVSESIEDFQAVMKNDFQSSSFNGCKRRSPSPPHQIKLFENQRHEKSEDSLESHLHNYEYKYGEVMRYTQKQAKQVDKIAQILQNEQESCDLFQLRILVNELKTSTQAASKLLQDGLLDVGECMGAVETMIKSEQQYIRQIQELKEGLEQNSLEIKESKEEHQAKLEELLNYIGSLKGKQSTPEVKEKRSYLEVRKKPTEQTDAQEYEIEKLKENVKQLTAINKNLELQVCELTRENQCYREQNSLLKETQEVLKREVETLRRESEFLRMSLNEAWKEEKLDIKRENKESQKERGQGQIRSRQGSPGRKSAKGPKKEDTYNIMDQDVEDLKKEIEYLNFKANALSKENEDLMKKLTDKVLIERENKKLTAKNQELLELVKTKTNDIDNMWKALKDTRDKLGPRNGYAFFSNVGKQQQGFDERPSVKHW